MEAAMEIPVDDGIVLYTYWRSSAAYRVRIGLELKGLAWEARPVHLVRDGGEQHRMPIGRSTRSSRCQPCCMRGMC